MDICISLIKIFFIYLNLIFNTFLIGMFFFLSLFSFLFLQVVLFPAWFGFLSHVRGLPKIPGNPEFFNLFKSEGPEKLSMGSMLMIGITDPEVHRKVI